MVFFTSAKICGVLLKKKELQIKNLQSWLNICKETKGAF